MPRVKIGWKQFDPTITADLGAPFAGGDRLIHRSLELREGSWGPTQWWCGRGPASASGMFGPKYSRQFLGCDAAMNGESER